MMPGEWFWLSKSYRETLQRNFSAKTVSKFLQKKNCWLYPGVSREVWTSEWSSECTLQMKRIESTDLVESRLIVWVWKVQNKTIARRLQGLYLANDFEIQKSSFLVLNGVFTKIKIFSETID